MPRRERRRESWRAPAVRLTAAALLSLHGGPAAGLEAGSRGRIAVRSMLEMRQERVVRQGWDLSCGAAALSTLLTYEHGDPIGELEIIRSILRQAAPERVRARHGFSLLDLKRFAVARGYAADGYGKLDAARLARLVPAIVPISAGDLNHFVVVRRVQGQRVVLADPGFGNRTMLLEPFEALWRSRVAFVVRARWGPPLPAPAGAAPALLVPVSVVRNTVGARP